MTEKSEGNAREETMKDCAIAIDTWFLRKKERKRKKKPRKREIRSVCSIGRTVCLHHATFCLASHSLAHSFLRATRKGRDGREGPNFDGGRIGSRLICSDRRVLAGQPRMVKGPTGCIWDRSRVACGEGRER